MNRGTSSPDVSHAFPSLQGLVSIFRLSIPFVGCVPKKVAFLPFIARSLPRYVVFFPKPDHSAAMRTA
jgi:hypothetical protein